MMVSAQKLMFALFSLVLLASSTEAFNIAFGVRFASSFVGGGNRRDPMTANTRKSPSSPAPSAPALAVDEATGGSSVKQFNQVCQQYIAESRQDYYKYVLECSQRSA